MILAHAPSGSDVSIEPSPDSSNLRVSHETALESGVPPARERFGRSAEADAAIGQLELALVESTRAEANLGLLMRGLRHLAQGASTAQEANAVLMQELESLRERMGRVYENESLLKQRVAALENALDAAARERESWFAQEDAFLVALLDEHEQKVFELERQHERRLAELDLSFDELRYTCESAKADVQRLTYERDAAVALLNEPVSAERAPTPIPGGSSERKSSSPRFPKPALGSKPDMASRPLVGYSLVSEDIDPETVKGTELASSPRHG